jgi:hypothetical protein
MMVAMATAAVKRFCWMIFIGALYSLNYFHCIGRYSIVP